MGKGRQGQDRGKAPRQGRRRGTPPSEEGRRPGSLPEKEGRQAQKAGLCRGRGRPGRGRRRGRAGLGRRRGIRIRSRAGNGRELPALPEVQPYQGQGKEDEAPSLFHRGRAGEDGLRRKGQGAGLRRHAAGVHQAVSEAEGRPAGPGGRGFHPSGQAVRHG